MRYFKVSDFDCQETGENEMKQEFLNRLDQLRYNCGFPFIVNSGFRSVNHSRERCKAPKGQHTKGIAADIKVVGGVQRGKIVAEAIKMGFTGIGVAKGFVHVDDRDFNGLMMWSY